MARLIYNIATNRGVWLFGTDWDLIININDNYIWRPLSEKVPGRVDGVVHKITDNLWQG